jgi:hypothetical protein
MERVRVIDISPFIGTDLAFTDSHAIGVVGEVMTSLSEMGFM